MTVQDTTPDGVCVSDVSELTDEQRERLAGQMEIRAYELRDRYFEVARRLRRGEEISKTELFAVDSDPDLRLDKRGARDGGDSR